MIATLGPLAFRACFDLAAVALVVTGLAWWCREISRIGEDEGTRLARRELARRRARRT